MSDVIELIKEIYKVKRNNGDKRDEKIIHRFDGRIIPLEPLVLKNAAVNLANKLNLENVDYIVGFAEGGILSAYGVSEATNIPLICSYRLRLDINNEINFIEPHSVRSQHYVYGLKKGDTIVIIDDEITTGDTLINALDQFSSNGIIVQDVGTFILCNSNETLDRFYARGYEVKYLYDENNISD